MRNKQARRRWIETRTLIIDEISMVDGKLFDKLEAIACVLRSEPTLDGKERPFGGIQVRVLRSAFYAAADNGHYIQFISW